MILVVNVSSPNTPGLRTLQSVGPLTNILTGVVGAAKATNRKTEPRVMVKVSPDEDSDEQIQGIVEAVWRSGVDGVIVGNTTKRRQGLIPNDTRLPIKEQQILEEQGGYSGPQMFERTLGLVKRYRKLLDQGPLPPAPSSSQSPSPPQSSQSQPSAPTGKAVAGLATGDEPASTIKEKIEIAKESLTPNGMSSTTTKGGLRAGGIGRGEQEQKVIFATGGITNGKQALEILTAGASVTMVYTAIVFGGVGTVGRIKGEMREQISRGKS